MATTAAPYGLRPVRSLSSGGYSAGHVRHYKVTNSYGTSLFYGDIVSVDANGLIIKDTDTNAITRAVGVFVGCEYTDPNLGYKLFRNMWLASTSATDIKAHIVDDPHMIYEIQADGQVAQTGLGANFSLVQTAGNTNIGMSKVALDADTGATTNTLPVRIVGFVEGPDSAVNDSYTDCQVMINQGIMAHLNSQGL